MNEKVIFVSLLLTCTLTTLVFFIVFFRFRLQQIINKWVAAFLLILCCANFLLTGLAVYYVLYVRSPESILLEDFEDIYEDSLPESIEEEAPPE